MNIPDSIRELIATGPLAHLTTLNPDGSPQVSVVWVGIAGDEFVCDHMGAWQKVKNIRRDPRVALSLLGRGKNPMGLQEYLVVYGQARITEGGAAALLQELARVYLGPGVPFPPESFRNRPGYITRLGRIGSPESGRGTRGKSEPKTEYEKPKPTDVSARRRADGEVTAVRSEPTQ